jgi:hypothetical protein
VRSVWGGKSYHTVGGAVKVAVGTFEENADVCLEEGESEESGTGRGENVAACPTEKMAFSLRQNNEVKREYMRALRHMRH